MKKIGISKKTLIEIIIAAVLIVAQFIWLLVKRLEMIGWHGEYFEIVGMPIMLKYLAVTMNIDIMYVVALLIINNKSEKNNKIFEVFIAALIFVAELIVALVCRFGIWEGQLSMFMNLINLPIFFFQINTMYVIVWQIVYSDKYKLCKTVIAALIPLAELLVIWICRVIVFSNQYTWSGDAKQLLSNVISIFASLCILYAIGLKIIDSLGNKDVKAAQNETGDEAILSQTSD